MRKQFKKITNKTLPVLDKVFRWLIVSAFELLKLIGLAFMVLHLVSADLLVEIAVTAIVVFASLHFTRFWK